MWWLRIRPSRNVLKARILPRTLVPYTYPIHVAGPVSTYPSKQHCRHAGTGSMGTAYYFSQDFPPIYATQQALEAVHTWTHLPWWITIIGITLVLRTAITLPLAIRQHRLVAKIELLQPTLKMMSEALKHREAAECKRAGKAVEQFNQSYKKKLLLNTGYLGFTCASQFAFLCKRRYQDWSILEQRRMMYELYQNEGCNPIKMFLLPWIQLPLWIAISLALRNMTGTSYSQRNTDSSLSDVAIPFPDMATEGALWFPNLLIPDPTLALPLAVGLFNLTNIEIHALRRQEPTRTQRVMTNSLRVLSVAMIMFASQVPTFFWEDEDELAIFITQKIAAEKEDDQRFRKLVTTSDLDKFGKSWVADNSRKKWIWVLRLYEEWRERRNETVLADPYLGEAVVNEALESMSDDELDEVLAKFVSEVRKTDGEEYPGKTLYEMAMCLYWAVSAGYGVFQNVTMKLPKVRRQLGIPKTPSESKKPFQDLKNIALEKADGFLWRQRQDPWRKQK